MAAVREECLYLEHKFRELTFFSTECDNIKSAAETVCRENSNLLNQIKELRNNLQDNNLVKDRHKVVEEKWKAQC